MGYAKHVGRVGALAVALGIGAAVATNPGVAWADGDDNPPAVDGGGAGGNTDTAGTATTSAQQKDPGKAISKSIERAADDLRSGISKVVTGVVRSSGGAITSTHRTGSNANNGNVPPVVDEDEHDQVFNPEPPKSGPQTFIANGNDAPHVFTPRWHAPQALVSSKPALKPGLKVLDDVKDSVQQAVNAATGNQPGMGSTSVQRNTISTLDAPPSTEDQQELRPRLVAPIAIVTNVLNAAIAPFLNPTPGQPAPQNPILWAVLGWVRRQVQDTPFGKVVLNRAPVAGDLDIDPVTGNDHLVVDVNATDPDGDEVHTVSATNGAHGTVTVNGDGTVTYDPNDTYEGTDTFSVTVSDEGSGFHLHGFDGLFGSDAGHTTTIPVTVLVSREDQSPVQVDPNTGKATKEVTLREGVVDDPTSLVGTKYSSQYGVAEITGYNEETRQYTITFTPNANLRLGNYAAAPSPQPVSLFSARRAAVETFAAAAVGAPQYDTVTITVGEPPNEQTFSFEVPITPARLRLNPDDLTVGDGPGPMAVSGNNLYVLNEGGAFTGGSATVSVIDTSTNTAVGAPIELPGLAIDIYSSGDRVYVHSLDGVYVIDATSNQLIDMDRSTQDEVDPIHLDGSLPFSTGTMAVEGDTLYVVNSGNTISVVRLGQDIDGHDTYTLASEPITLDGVQSVYAIAVSGNRLYAADYSGNAIRVVDLTPGVNYGEQVGSPIQVGGTPVGVAVSPPDADTSFVYVSTLGQSMAVIDPSTNQVVKTIALGPSQSLAFSPDATLLYVGGVDTVSVIDTATNQLVLTTVADRSPEGAPNWIAASPDNAHIYVSDLLKSTASNLNDKVSVISFHVGPDENPPVVDPITNPTAGQANPASGAVSVLVHATDENGDALSVTVSDPPDKGTVTIAPGTGGDYIVTYTPNGQARLDAYNGGDTSDEFIITVNDGQQSVSERIEIPIVGAEAAVTNTYAISDTAFVYPRSIAIDENGNLFFTVARPNDPANPSSYIMSLVTVNDSHPVNINSNANGANSAVNNLAVDGTGRAYVINPDTSVTKPLGAVAIYDGDNLVQERQVGGTPIALFNGANGDVYAVVALYEDRGGTVQRVVSVYDVTNDSSLGEAYVRPFAGSEDLTDAAVGTDGRIYVTNPDDQTVVVVGGSTPIEMGGTPVGLAVNPDDGRVYAIVSHPAPDSAATLKLVEIKNDGTTVDLGDVYTTPANSGQYASYSDIAVRGDRVYVTNVGDPLALGSGSISVLDADTGAQLTPIGLGSNPFASTKPIRVVISPDGEHAYVVTESGYVSEISFADTADSAVNV